MRLFVALPLEPGVREAIAEASAPLRAAGQGSLSWTATCRLHLTLKFLGDVADERVDSIADALVAVAARHRAVELELGGFGAFPSSAHPRVVWLGVAPTTRLELLQHDVELALDALGFPLAGRPFRPHVTVARARGRVAPAIAAAVAAAGDQAHFHDVAHPDGVDLARSELLADGARHTIVHAARFRAE